MNELTDRDVLDGLVDSLERHEAERTLASLKSGNPFDAGIVEGISNAIEKIDSARTNTDLRSIVQALTSGSELPEQEDESDAYAKGMAAGASHVAELVREELDSTPTTDY